MGTSSSSLHELRDNKYLQLFSGKDSITPNDPFWNQLLSFTFVPPHSCSDFRLLEDSIRPMLDTLLNTNPLTGNVAALIKVFLLHASELKTAIQCENRVFIWQAYNSLFILRCILKYFIETLGEEGLLTHLQDCQQNESDDIMEPEKLLESLINAIFEILVDISLSDITYVITVEAVNTLIILLSVQMFSSQPACISSVYRIVMEQKCSSHSLMLVKNLLVHYSNQDKCPHCVRSMEGGSLITGLAASLWNVLTWSSATGSEMKNASTQTVLANQSLLLLLALVNHCTNEKDINNPYRAALFSFINSKEPVIETSADVFQFDFDKLFSTLCSTLKDDQTALLMYLLLHRNQKFRSYVTQSSEVHLLVEPLLKLLYDAPEKNSHLIYMALIVLLILSEDDYFDKQIHVIKLKNIPWYSERLLSEITLGGLIMLVLIRTIQYNMTRMHDKYLHTNCLAALANMSAYLQNLHPYVCQKFITLLENMGKRYIKITCQSEPNEGRASSSDSKELLSDEKTTSSDEKSSPKKEENLPSERNLPSDDDLLPTDLMQDLSVLEEVLRMLLEILNSCLTFQLKNNTNLLYTILYKKDIFQMFRSHSNFQDIMQNIDAVLMFFVAHLEAVDRSLSVVEVSQIIKSVSLQWSKEKLKKLPELKFKYVEEGQPEDFFIPYLWSVVFHFSDIYWNPKNILIFNPFKSTC